MPKILIVDDEKDTADMLARRFSSQDYEVETAHSGETAVEKVKAIRPHIMLLDIQMPGMDGIEALKQAREADPSLGIIMVTGLPDEEVARNAMHLGAHDFVTKPIDFNYLSLSVSTKVIDMVG